MIYRNILHGAILLINFLLTDGLFTYSPYRNIITTFDVDKIKSFNKEMFYLPFEQNYTIYLFPSIRQCIANNKNIHEETKQNILKEETIDLFSDYSYIKLTKKNETITMLNEALFNCIITEIAFDEYDENCISKILFDCIVNLKSLDKEIKDLIREAFFNVLKAEKNQRQNMYIKWKEKIKDIIDNKPDDSFMLTQCVNKCNCDQIFNKKE